MSVAGGESRRMACPRRVSSHQSCSTSTLMTSQSTRNFIHADDLCVTTQYSSFTEVETTIGDALDEFIPYYRSNSLRANPDKTQVIAFHLRKKRPIDHKKWNGTRHNWRIPPPDVPRCYFSSHAKLQRAHTQYKDEGGYPQQY